MSRTTIETHSGLFYDYLDPKPEQVCIEDIAHALSMTSRFGGHCSRFYSVAEHSCLVRQLVIEAGRPDLGLAALLHDAHEAYVGDIPTPLKEASEGALSDIVADCDYTIAVALGHSLNFHAPAIIKADRSCLRFEAAVLKCSKGTGEHWGYEQPAHRDKFIRCHESQAAKWRFLRDYYEETQ